MMTTCRVPIVVPARGFVTKITLLQSRAFSAGHLSHHAETALHEMARRRGMALRALARRGRGVNVVRDEPALGCVARSAILSEVSLVHVPHLVAGHAVEQLLLRAERVVRRDHGSRANPIKQARAVLLFRFAAPAKLGQADPRECCVVHVDRALNCGRMLVVAGCTLTDSRMKRGRLALQQFGIVRVACDTIRACHARY